MRWMFDSFKHMYLEDVIGGLVRGFLTEILASWHGAGVLSIVKKEDWFNVTIITYSFVAHRPQQQTFAC